ncbi:GL18680 [Drosophila persimilis]|uniref:GL18680 n=2 Tax=Drosophila persimilis TaxID=7234 RepID=B4G9B7_DROPE|nr:mucin-19 isoform X1 [Drosophila persimilis]EDW28947.1 GL18680 [Drosophila persimilis]
MIKFVRQKNRENPLKASKNFLRKKRESNDSGTESDGELLDVEKQRHLDVDMETTVAGQKPIAPAMMCHQQTSSSCAHLMYDQHSSEEELEVINGPSSVAGHGHSTTTATGASCASRLSNRGCTSSLDTEAPYEERATTSNSKRSSSTLMVENRKRSLAHSSDDELRNSLEPILTPVNFRTSPPLEAFKPNRSHMTFRSTTPLILSEARCGIENIKLCDNSVNEENGDNSGGGGGGNGGNHSKCPKLGGAVLGGGNENEPSVIKACSSSLKMSNSSHHIYQPQPKYSFHYNSSRSSPASTTGLDMEVRSVSPPAKLFHCAISPRRRPSNNSGGGGSATAAGTAAPATSSSTGGGGGAAAAAGGGTTSSTAAATTTHNAANAASAAAATQRLQRPHRPCLDFDKMQQVSL